MPYRPRQAAFGGAITPGTRTNRSLAELAQEARVRERAESESFIRALEAAVDQPSNTVNPRWMNSTRANTFTSYVGDFAALPGDSNLGVRFWPPPTSTQPARNMEPASEITSVFESTTGGSRVVFSISKHGKLYLNSAEISPDDAEKLAIELNMWAKEARARKERS